MTILHDDAGHAARPNRNFMLFAGALVRTMGRPRKKLNLISPCSLPERDKGTAALVTRAEQRRAEGARVRRLPGVVRGERPVVCGLCEAPAENMLRAGVELYEIKTTAAREAGVKMIRSERSERRPCTRRTFSPHGPAHFNVGSFNFIEISAGRD